jgi:hypothetical protein
LKEKAGEKLKVLYRKIVTVHGAAKSDALQTT